MIQQSLYRNFEFQKILVGVSGGSGAGKTTLCNTIENEMKVDKNFNVQVMNLDGFQFGIRDYKGDIHDFNFDDANFIDWDLLEECLSSLLAGKKTLLPTYNFVLHQREPKEKWNEVQSRDIILLEGIFALHKDKIRRLMNYMIYMECDDDIRLARRLIRDVKERGRDVEGILYQYNRFVKPCQKLEIEPQARFADFVVPGFKNNKVAVNMIVQQLKTQSKELNKLKEQMKNHLLFFGDILHELQMIVGLNKVEAYNNCLTLIDDSFQRKVFFANDPQSKRELMVFVQYLVDRQQFTLKQYKKTLKYLFKHSFENFKNALLLKGIAFSELVVWNLSDLLTQNEEIVSKPDEKLNSGDPSRYVVLLLPYLIDDQSLLAKINQYFKQRRTFVIIICLFSHLQNVMDVPYMDGSLLFMVNTFLLVLKDQFKASLDNLVDKSIDLKSNLFMSDYFYNKLKSKIEKNR